MWPYETTNIALLCCANRVSILEPLRVAHEYNGETAQIKAFCSRRISLPVAYRLHLRSTQTFSRPHMTYIVLVGR